MRRGDGRRAKPWVTVAAAVVTLTATGPRAVAEPASNVRLRDPAQRFAVAQAVQGAARRLARPRCEALLDEFTDAGNRSLRDVLDGEGLSVDAFLARVLFYDAAPVACQTSAMAGMDAPGSRVVRVCGRRFQRAVDQSRDHAEAIVIHEMLHALGLGENPPSSDFITTRVMESCLS